jgi:Transposase IS116/IS110/IS902 family
LLRYYPAALEVFSELMAPISLAFICAYPTPEAATQLSYADFSVFARQHQHHQPQKWPGCYARLQAQQPAAALSTVVVYQAEAVHLAQLLLATLQTKQQTLRELKRCFSQHPDAPIFSSLPGTGDFLAPALLAKFGEERRRFPEPVDVQALAGTCPVTESSGKRRWVHYRQACDHDFRYIMHLWAKESLRQSPFAAAYYHQVRPRCDSESHAYRCLANRWLAIVWKLWQTRQPYDESYHLRQRALRSQPRSGSA